MQLLDQVRPLLAQLSGKLLGPPRWANEPAVVPEVALEAAADRGDREGQKRAVVRIVALDRLDQAAPGDLLQVLGLLTAMLEPPG